MSNYNNTNCNVGSDFTFDELSEMANNALANYLENPTVEKYKDADTHIYKFECKVGKMKNNNEDKSHYSQILDELIDKFHAAPKPEPVSNTEGGRRKKRSLRKTNRKHKSRHHKRNTKRHHKRNTKRSNKSRKH